MYERMIFSKKFCILIVLILLPSFLSLYKHIIMIKRILNFVVTIIANGLVLYSVARYIPELWLALNWLDLTLSRENLLWFFIFGAVFWLMHTIIKRLLNLVTLPLRFVTFWLSGLAINVIIFYGFRYIINTEFTDLAVTVQLWTIMQTLLLSLVIRFLMRVVNKVIDTIF